MLESLKALDTRIFLFLNGLHFPILDQIMWMASYPFFWIPFYIWFLWLLYRAQKTNFWLVILSIIAMIVISDQLCNFFKFEVMRLRPSNEPTLKPLIHLVNGYSGGTYGFYSAHASNSFAFATFIFMLVKQKNGYLIPILLTYALLASYSRIYLGVYYPGDVITGIIIGIIIGAGMGKLFFGLTGKIEKKKEPAESG